MPTAITWLPKQGSSLGAGGRACNDLVQGKPRLEDIPSHERTPYAGLENYNHRCQFFGSSMVRPALLRPLRQLAHNWHPARRVLQFVSGASRSAACLAAKLLRVDFLSTFNRVLGGLLQLLLLPLMPVLMSKHSQHTETVTTVSQRPQLLVFCGHS